MLDTKALQAAHVGISIFDPAADKYLYNYQGDKYFVPASNTKLPTCYAAMKYLGDSLTSALVDETDTSIVIIPKEILRCYILISKSTTNRISKNKRRVLL